jgi:hypothetical protein
VLLLASREILCCINLRDLIHVPPVRAVSPGGTLTVKVVPAFQSYVQWAALNTARPSQLHQSLSWPFMAHKSSFPFSQQPVTRPYSEPDKCTQYHIYLKRASKSSVPAKPSFDCNAYHYNLYNNNVYNNVYHKNVNHTKQTRSLFFWNVTQSRLVVPDVLKKTKPTLKLNNVNDR